MQFNLLDPFEPMIFVGYFLLTFCFVATTRTEFSFKRLPVFSKTLFALVQLVA